MAEHGKEFFVKELGESRWDKSWEDFARLDPEFFAAAVKLSAVPRKKKHLSPKIQALILLSFAPGVRLHVKEAMNAGATAAEVMEVVELTSTLGIHACNIGVPILVEVMKEEGIFDSHPTAGKPFDESRQKLQEDFTKKRGYWHSFWEEFLALDPEFFEAYTEFSSVPWTKQVEGSKGGKGVLEPKVEDILLYYRAVLTRFSIGQRTRILCVRLCINTSIPIRTEGAHAKCTSIWRHSRGDTGSS